MIVILKFHRLFLMYRLLCSVGWYWSQRHDIGYKILSRSSKPFFPSIIVYLFTTIYRCFTHTRAYTRKALHIVNVVDVGLAKKFRDSKTSTHIPYKQDEFHGCRNLFIRSYQYSPWRWFVVFPFLSTCLLRVSFQNLHVATT